MHILLVAMMMLLTGSASAENWFLDNPGDLCAEKIFSCPAPKDPNAETRSSYTLGKVVGGRKQSPIVRRHGYRQTWFSSGVTAFGFIGMRTCRGVDGNPTAYSFEIEGKPTSCEDFMIRLQKKQKVCGGCLKSTESIAR